MTTISHLPLVELSGGPREKGRQYGEQAAARIRLGVEHYTAQLGKSISWPDVKDMALRFEPQIIAFDPAYAEEMRGIAEGAGVEYEAVIMLNCRTEVLKLAEQRAKGRPLPLDPDGCTGAVILPKAAAAGHLIHAQNWDWKVECADSSLVLRIQRDDGPDILTLTEAGVLARFGFNSAGISITGNYLECDRDYRRIGVPLALIRRKVLEQESLAVAMQTVYATAKSASNNIIVAHANGVAIDFECVPDETFQVLPQNGLIVHANHFQSPVALAKLLDTGIANMPDSLYRDIRVRELLEPHVGRLTPELTKQAFFDDFETPFSVCRPPRSTFSKGNQSATVAMIVMEPALGTMDVAVLPALNRSFTTYALSVDIRRPNQSGEGARPAT